MAKRSRSAQIRNGKSKDAKGTLALILSIIGSVAGLSSVVGVYFSFRQLGEMKRQNANDSIALEGLKEQVSVAKDNLEEMKKQTGFQAEAQKLLESQNKSTIKIFVDDVKFYPRLDDSCLTINYHYAEQGNPEGMGIIFWELSLSKGKDIMKWMDKERNERQNQKNQIRPASFDTEHKKTFCEHGVVDSLRKAFSGPGPWVPGDCYIYIIYKFQDQMQVVHWVYSRWNFSLSWNGQVISRADCTSPKNEFFREWESNKIDEMVPNTSDLQQELK